MSVPKTMRGEGQLVVLTKAYELAEYTIKICKNEKHFPKSYRWCLTSKIVDSAVSIYTKIRQSNAIYVQTVDDFELRRRYQVESLALADSLLGLIDLSYRIFGIDSINVEHWSTLVAEVQRLLRKWRKSDEQRYKDLG